jgi:RNA polymerase sigma factor (sigma-70 family)
MNTSLPDTGYRHPVRGTSEYAHFFGVDGKIPCAEASFLSLHLRGYMASPDSKTRAYTARYTEFYPLISSIVYSRIHDPETTHDLCQEIFLRYYTKFEEVENHRAWLIGTANFVVLEHYRKKKGTTVDIDGMEEILEEIRPAGTGETRIMIEEALENPDNFGSEKNRVLFDLIAIHDFTFKEAGRNLGISEPQARYRFNAVAVKLVAYFRKKGIRGMEELL